MLKKILNFIYPDTCIFCRKIIGVSAYEKQDFTCNNCKKKLEYIRGQNDLKKSCNTYFDYLLYAFKYEGFVRTLLLDFKFYNKTYLHEFFASEILKIIQKFSQAKYDYILYVPISINRYFARGFNQSYMIAKYISNHINIPILKYGLVKIKNNKIQSTLKIAQRKQNVSGVYKVLFRKSLAGKKVLLVDDIFTTGSTVNECSRILKDAGVLEITVATIARA